MHNVEIIVLLLFGVTFLAIMSARYRFPFPIVLVLSGLAISLIPGLPSITLRPDVIFLIFLPPLLYEASWNTSWHTFKANLRSITLASIGLVFFTTVIVGVLVHTMIPGFSWPMAFLLGAIISPPDAIAATSITKGLGLHPRIVTILEGESLINDASALVAYKYALTAILVGGFSFGEAGLDFFKVFIGGIAIGLAVGYIMYLVHTRFVCDSIVEVTLTFLTPFASYLLAEQFHLSGVLAVVTTGLYLSFRSAQMFTHQSRMQTYAVWEVVSFILNGLVFILMGLQLKTVIKDFDDSYTVKLVSYGVIIGLVALVVRFVWTVPAVFLPRMLSKRIRESEEFDRRNVLIFIWAGMRGIVSMAAALSLPLSLQTGSPFPYRSEIIFLTFCVILFTLIFQGLTLPRIIKKLKLPKHSILAEEYTVRTQLINDMKEYVDGQLPNLGEDVRSLLHQKYDGRNTLLQQTNLPKVEKKGVSPSTAIFNQFVETELELLEIERFHANELRKTGKASEQVIRKIEREIDLEESRLRLELYTD